MSKVEVGGVSPFFIVRNVPSALAFYRDRLGFEIMFQGPEPDDIFFGIVTRGSAMVMMKDIGVEPIPNYTRDVKKGFAPWGSAGRERLRPLLRQAAAAVYLGAGSKSDTKRLFGSAISAPSRPGGIGVALPPWVSILSPAPRAASTSALMPCVRNWIRVAPRS